MTQKEIILAVANQIQNMMYNDITCEQGVECFEAWCANGEVFELEGKTKAEAEECMQVVRRVAPLVDNLILNNLNINCPDMVSQRKDYVVECITWSDKVSAIIDAAENQTFSDEIEDIDLLSYTKVDKQGQSYTFEDRFDYIDTTTIPALVHFIGGTGCENFSVPISCLTEESIDRLYECVMNK